ncbi:Bromodomain [Dillenia turbinata]|uniref:Bromodomain n=1 Tax=Dillenia turbinata TaxID=194707 RepID=A0AAN8V433_9MAGN
MAPTIPIEYTGQKVSKKFSLSQSQMMGKTRKYSKGHLSGFVPDSRHVVETMGESEGFGSSGRVDTEMMASEDSCAPKRKCLSMNVDGYDRFGVPMQVISLSKLSQYERKDLEVRLRNELELVQVLQRKVTALSSGNAVVLSPTSDIRSCSDGKRKPPLESLERPTSVYPSHGKKKAPGGRVGPKTKKSSSVHFESVRQVAPPPQTSSAVLMKQCEALLTKLMTHPHGWVFNEPVDVVKLNIPDYFNVIKHPMDLGTIKTKLAAGEYSSPLDFAADVRLTFSNALTYNPPGNDVHFMAKTLSKSFEVRWKSIEKKLSATTVSQPELSRPIFYEETENAHYIPPPKKKKTIPPEPKPQEPMVKPEQITRIMTGEEKHKLSTELEDMLAELPENIIDFLKERSFNASQTSDDEIEIDIDALSDDTLFELRKLLDEYLLEKKKKQAKSEPREVELLNESGFSNSSLPPPKGKSFSSNLSWKSQRYASNDPADEDVDIGGNDPLASNYPPLEIEKEMANKNGRCGSSSSSSSESGSSSCDSDSDSSSASEPDGAKASILVDAVKDTCDSETNVDDQKNAHGDSDAKDKFDSGLDQVEQTYQSQPAFSEADGHQEGESTPSERQVSPKKLYRAAMMRKKAQLQAEAKAVEEARKKAQAEAAAEAKRKRELEREAARQALLQGTSNPLEQLGLYMKDDDDEEEEVEPESAQSAPEPVMHEPG